MPRRAGPLIKTVKVKLHNPSKHKRAMLDKVFLRWTLAADVTLRWAQEHLDAFNACKDRRDNYRANLIASVLRQHIHLRIKRLGLHSSLEDALWRDIGKALASYRERLKQERALHKSVSMDMGSLNVPKMALARCFGCPLNIS